MKVNSTSHLFVALLGHDYHGSCDKKPQAFSFLNAVSKQNWRQQRPGYRVGVKLYHIHIIIMESLLTTKLNASSLTKAVVDTIDSCFRSSPLPFISLFKITIVSNTLNDNDFNVFAVLTF